MTSPNDLRTELLANADRLEAEDDTLIAYNIREAVAAIDERDELLRTMQQRECSSWCDPSLNEHTRFCQGITRLLTNPTPKE